MSAHIKASAHQELLELRLKGLRLPGFLAHYAALAKKAASEGWDVVQYLGELAAVECVIHARKASDSRQAGPRFHTMSVQRS